MKLRSAYMPSYTHNRVCEVSRGAAKRNATALARRVCNCEVFCREGFVKLRQNLAVYTTVVQFFCGLLSLTLYPKCNNIQVLELLPAELAGINKTPLYPEAPPANTAG